MFEERDLVRALTGLVVDGFAVEPDVAEGRVSCADCPEDGTLETGDRVTATITYYENHTWEPTGVYCGEHAVASVEEDMDVAAEEQVVIGAILERTGYLDPTGEFHPEALTLGQVAVLDHSPAGEGYE